MYTWEINKILEENNYSIDSRTYGTICSTSPQIDHIKYDAWNNNFEIHTKDSPSSMFFKVYPAGN